MKEMLYAVLCCLNCPTSARIISSFDMRVVFPQTFGDGFSITASVQVANFMYG